MFLKQNKAGIVKISFKKFKANRKESIAMFMLIAGEFTIHLEQIKNEEEAWKDIQFLSMLEVNKN